MDVAPVMPCQNSSWIMCSRIYVEGRSQIRLSSIATIDPLGQDPGWGGSTLIKKIARSTRVNHIAVSFTNHHNAISFDTLTPKSKIGKYSWYFFNNCLTTNNCM